MATTVSTEEYIAINEMAEQLLDYDYYNDVAFEFIEEAVATTYRETGMALDGENLEAYHQYISENLI